jgi:DNA-binding FrmR family transcriptional regulator
MKTKKKTSPVRHAVHVDAEPKKDNLRRLARVEGQVRGIARMVDEERYCADILVQIRGAQNALRAVAASLVQNHLRHCARTAFRAGPDEQEKMVEELTDLFREGT